MIKRTCSIDIHKDAQGVFKVAETYPLFVTFFNKKIILQSSSAELNVRVGMNRYGINFVWEGIGRKEFPRRISFVQTKGLLKGLKAIWEFQQTGPGTCHASIHSEFTKKFPIIGSLVEGPLSKYLVEKTTVKILQELKKACEQ